MSAEEASCLLGPGPGYASRGLSGETSSCPEHRTVPPAVSSGQCRLVGDSGVGGAELLFLPAVGELRPKSPAPHSKVGVTRVFLSILAPSHGRHHHVSSRRLRFNYAILLCRLPCALSRIRRG